MATMYRKLSLIISLPVLLFMAQAAPAGSPDETSGQILGGSLDAPIRLEVFSDFQCPACRDLYLGTIRPVLLDYASKDKVCVIYHEFPLTIHQHAREAAKYAEATYRLNQQKMLPVMDSLFSDQSQWSQDGKLEAVVAKALSSEDLQKVKKIMQDPSVNQAIDREVALGEKRAVKSTPTLFLYYLGREQKVEGIVTYPVLKQFLDSIVK